MIDTARTRLDVLHERHAARLGDYYRENAVHLKQWEPVRPGDFTSLSSCAARARQAQLNFKHDLSVNLVAISKADKSITAICNFTNILKGPMMACNLGYSVCASHQGQGLMGEVITAALPYMFNTIGLHRIMANHLPENDRSAALLARLGFEKEGYAKAYLKINGQWRDHVLTAKINPQHTESASL